MQVNTVRDFFLFTAENGQIADFNILWRKNPKSFIVLFRQKTLNCTS